MIAAGAAIGLAVSAVGGGRLLATMLCGVQPLDPVTFTAGAVMLALTTVAAAAGPAWRAAGIDPAAALRRE